MTRNALLSASNILRTFTALSALAVGTVSLMASTAQAQTIGDPTVFHYTGANQTYVVPVGVTTLQVELWGAGGAGLYGIGGGGGYVTGNLSVTAGQVLNIIVGGGGTTTDTTGAYGGGGNGDGYAGGGGRSALDSLDFSTEFITAGGGGGGAGAEFVGQGGAGGGEVGGDGMVNGSNPDGGGGTQTAGGTPNNEGNSGSAFQGGDVNSDYTSSNFSLAAGGGGYYGGSSGFAAGGGGSSYFSSSLLNGTGSSIVGSGNAVGNNESDDYLTFGGEDGVGVGYDDSQSGYPSDGGSGGNGLVVLRAISGSGAAAAPEPGALALAASVLPVFGLAARRLRRKSA